MKKLGCVLLVVSMFLLGCGESKTAKTKTGEKTPVVKTDKT
jgi:hypothetical protein